MHAPTCPHLPPTAASPLPPAGGLCRSLRLWWGGSRDGRAGVQLLAPSPSGSCLGRAADPPTQIPPGFQGPHQSGGWACRTHPIPVSCPMVGICLQLCPFLPRCGDPGFRRSSALEGLSPVGGPGRPGGHRAQPSGGGEFRGRGPKAAVGHQGPPGASWWPGEWGRQ